MGVSLDVKMIIIVFIGTALRRDRKKKNNIRLFVHSSNLSFDFRNITHAKTLNYRINVQKRNISFSITSWTEG